MYREASGCIKSCSIELHTLQQAHDCSGSLIRPLTACLLVRRRRRRRNQSNHLIKSAKRVWKKRHCSVSARLPQITVHLNNPEICIRNETAMTHASFFSLLLHQVPVGNQA